MLMKLTIGVNFIDISCALFLYECYFGSFFSTYVCTYVHKKKLPKQHSYEKSMQKTLMKLTVGGQLLTHLPLSSSATSMRTWTALSSTTRIPIANSLRGNLPNFLICNRCQKN
jgi:hypothetical protein